MIKIDVVYECDRCGKTAGLVYDSMKKNTLHENRPSDFGDYIIKGLPHTWGFFNTCVFCDDCYQDIISVIATPPKKT